MANNILRVEHIAHTFRHEETRRGIPVLQDISFSVPRGAFVSIIGPSGSGKSTLLKIIAGLLIPTRGHIENNASKLSMVFQNFAVFPWLTVLENIEFGLTMSGVDPHERRKIALEKLAEVKLTGSEHKYPGELSGGMRQRVGIARALAVSPDLLLLDEPFSSLDELTAEKLRDDLMALWEKYKMTVLMVTHLVEEAVSLSDEVIIVSASPAIVKKKLAIEISRPRQKRSPEYFALVDAITSEID